MFLHEFIYEMKCVLRQKDELFWVLIFPIILGSMFFFAFGKINENTENFHTIPVAVCVEEGADSHPLKDILELLSKEGDTPLLELVYTDWEDAARQLGENTVRGIFKLDQNVSLSCSPLEQSGQNSSLSIEQSILESILREYQTNSSAISDIAKTHPERLKNVLSLLEEDAEYGTKLELSSGNMDSLIQYYFNLIAMACLFTSFAGSQIAIKSQANLSPLGAKKCISPNGKFISVTAQLLSCLITQFFCVAVNILYLFFVLKIEFGASLPWILLTSFIGCIMGIGFGFFIGSIGKVSEASKTGIMISSSLLCCFLSGLMIGNMRPLIESACPVINDVNPAVLISDSFLTLNIYGASPRYAANLAGLLIYTLIFVTAGCLMVRRKTYASL